MVEVLGLARAMRHHRRVAGLVRHLDRGERLGERADLVDLDQDRVAEAALDAVGEPRDVGDEQVVADELALVADQIGDLLPAVEVVFRHAVLDRDDRVAANQVGEVLRLLLDGAGFSFAIIDILAVLEEFG